MDTGRGQALCDVLVAAAGVEAEGALAGLGRLQVAPGDFPFPGELRESLDLPALDDGELAMELPDEFETFTSPTGPVFADIDEGPGETPDFGPFIGATFPQPEVSGAP